MSSLLHPAIPQQPADTGVLQRNAGEHIQHVSMTLENVLTRRDESFVSCTATKCKLREEIAKARAEKISSSVLTTYGNKFGTFLFDFNIDYRSFFIETLILPNKKELDLYYKMESSQIAYDFLILHVHMEDICNSRSLLWQDLVQF